MLNYVFILVNFNSIATILADTISSTAVVKL